MSTSRKNSPTSDDARVIVVGCGLAGLRCASLLVKDHGMSKDQIVLLEGSDRIGGRIMTDKSFVEGFSVSASARTLLRSALASCVIGYQDDSSLVASTQLWLNVWRSGHRTKNVPPI